MNRKIILITGGTTGIGFSCAEYLLGKGYDVIITGRNQDNLTIALEKLQGNVSGYLSDVTKLEDLNDLVDIVKTNVGTIDGLFVNAGVFIPSAFEETTEEVFDKTMDVNFKGAFFTVQKFVPILKNPSSIVLTTSIAVFTAFMGGSVYSASKAAMESLARSLSFELAPKGIRVNVLSPGVTETPIQRKAGMSEEDVKNMVSSIEASSPIGRVLHPDDMAPVVEFLMSDGSKALRNEVIIVDGGTTL